VHARRTAAALAALTAVGLVGSAQGAWASPGPSHHGGHQTRVVQTNVVSDIPGLATLTDPNLINPWGLSFLPTSPLWTSNNGTSTATLFSGAPPATPNAIVPLVVNIPGGPPTGTVSNSTTGFVVSSSLGSGPARFMFAGLGGAITAWNPAAAPTDAIVVASTPGAVYTGLTMLTTSSGAPVLLASDFAHGRIDVFDQTFTKIGSSRLFRDNHLPRGFKPFNVQAIGTDVYVAYAKADPVTGRSVDGRGLGIVDKFTRDGRHLDRIATGGTLNGPWGVALVPAGFGSLTGRLLIGNFGDGHVGVYEVGHGDHFRGLLRAANGRPFQVDRLWALLPGTATSGGTDAIWFSAGIGNETHGLVGTLKAAPDTH
jgi:uncharacterized protein (TIGR03118 family)